MALTLYMHPLASFCHKVLIALYENAIAFRSETVDFGDPASAAALLERWPVGKIPILYDEPTGRTVPETSIIIEYLQLTYPGPVPLLPRDTEALLQTRLWDRFFDLYVSTPMQRIVTDRIRPGGRNDPHGVADAHASLDTAYAMIERQVSGNQWAIGEVFTMADCAAASALFFASIVHPFASNQTGLRDYLDRLLARPSVTRTLREARPFFEMFPYRDAMPARYLAL